MKGNSGLDLLKVLAFLRLLLVLRSDMNNNHFEEAIVVRTICFWCGCLIFAGRSVTNQKLCGMLRVTTFKYSFHI